MDRHLSREAAETLVVRALLAAGVAEAAARSVAEALVAAEIDGQGGHGFSRVAAYAAQARAGKVRGEALASVTRPAPGVLSIDAGHGFAYPALDRAIEALPAVAREVGIAAAVIHRSHHCGTLTHHVERLAEAGLVALMFANSPKAIAPWGGSAALFGTNPIGFAAPRREAPPLVIDLSLSKVARGRVMAAAQAGDPIPEGWALDAEGRPTTDARAALAGTMLPFGDAKGAALALMVEVFAAALTGAVFSADASSFFDTKGAPPGVGQMIIACDPTPMAGAGFANRIEQLLASVEAEPGARLPGQRRLEGRARAAEAGIAINAARYAELSGLANGDPPTGKA